MSIEPITCWPPDEDAGELSSGDAIQDEDIPDISRSTSKPHVEELPTFPACKRPRVELPLDSDEEGEPLATVALARWWRTRRKIHSVESKEQHQSHNPNTILKLAARSTEGREFLKLTCTRLKEKLRGGRGSWSVHAALGTFLEKLGNLHDAKHHLDIACAGPRRELDSMEVHLARCRVQKKLDIQALQLGLMSTLPRNLPPPAFSAKVAHRSASSLSFPEFLFEYALKRQPVVITGLVELMTSEPWTLDHIKRVAGRCQVNLKRLVKQSVEWARLESAGVSTVADYVDSVMSNDADKEDRYLFDWSLPQHCPQLADQLTIPKYFAGDFLQRTSPGSLYQDSWPSLFVAPAGLRSETHVDAFGSNFWMALFQGRKRWTLFPREDLPLLYPSYEHCLDPVFDVDLSQPDLQHHPLLALTSPWQHTLEPGEVLFVPEGCPHRVENLETSIAISANYVDLSNFAEVKRHLVVNGMVDPQAKNLLAQITNPSFPVKMNSRVTHTPWQQFKDRDKNYKDYDY